MRTRSSRRFLEKSRGAYVLALAVAYSGFPALAQGRKAPDKDGTVHLDGLNVPVSNLMRPEAREFLRSVIVDKPLALAPKSPPGIEGERADGTRIMNGFSKPMRARYAVNVSEDKIGVVDVVTPVTAIFARNKNRILIDVHGGGFSSPIPG